MPVFVPPVRRGKIIMHLNKLAFGLALGGWACLLAPSVLAESLLELHELAVDSDPQFQADFHGKQATDERYYQARSALLPQINVNVERSEISQDIVSTDNEVYGSGSTSYPTTVYGVSLEQSIYDYSRWAAFGQAKLEIQQAASELEVSRQDLYLRVAERYFAVLALSENLSFLQAEKKQVQTNLEQVRARFEDGLIREIDLLDAQARFLQVEARELDVANRLRDALNALAEVSGVRPVELSLVDEDLTLASPEPSSVEAWIELAMQRNPRLSAARLAVEVANQQVKVSRGGHYPTLDLSLDYDNDETEGSLFGGGSEVETQTIRVGLDVPVYSGGRVSSEVREGTRLIEAGQARLEQVRRELDREIRAAFEGIVTAMSRVRALSESLTANQRIVEYRQVAYESGVMPVLELLDAERDLFFARSELASARYDYLISVLRLKHAAGVINGEDLAEIDAHMNDRMDLLAFQH